MTEIQKNNKQQKTNQSQAKGELERRSQNYYYYYTIFIAFLLCL